MMDSLALLAAMGFVAGYVTKSLLVVRLESICDSIFKTQKRLDRADDEYVQALREQVQAQKELLDISQRFIEEMKLAVDEQQIIMRSCIRAIELGDEAAVEEVNRMITDFEVRRKAWIAERQGT